MLLQGLDRHLLEGRDLLQIPLNVADVGAAESAENRGAERPPLVNHLCTFFSMYYAFLCPFKTRYHACGKQTTLLVCGVKRAQVQAQETLQLPRIFGLRFQDILEDLAKAGHMDINI